MEQNKPQIHQLEIIEPNIGSAFTKAVGSIKEVTQIRKITQQTLSPFIKKLEQQIMHLLQQSTHLRKQTQTLQKVQITNSQFKHQIQSLKLKLHELTTQIIETNQLRQNKQKDNQRQFTQFYSVLQQLKRQNQEKNSKLQNLTELNQHHSEIFALVKQNMDSNTNFFKQQISFFYEKNIKLNHLNTQKINQIEKLIATHQKKIPLIQKEIQKIIGVTTLYSAERFQIRSYLQQAIELSHQAIRRQQYEIDKRYHRVENELTKSHVQKVINQALTPQIRTFLPNLIQNIELLEKLDKQIKQCTKQLINLKQTEKQISLKLLQIDNFTKKSFQQINLQTKKLQNKIKIQLSSLVQNIRIQIQNTTNKLSQCQQKIQKQKTQSKQIFDSFIQKNRMKIYLAVLQCKPPQVEAQQKKIKEKLCSFQLKMDQIRQTATERSDNVLNIANSLENKLELFQNRITKAKSDMKVENDNIKKLIDGFNFKLNDSSDKIHNQSKMISKLLEVSLINTSLQIDEEYFHFSSKYNEQNSIESFISFHDGIIYEITGDSKIGQTVYRKKRLNKEILKRCLLNQQAKLIDFITEKLNSWNWTQSKERPSHFFIENIYPAYETFIVEKKSLIEKKQRIQEKKSTLKNPLFKVNSQRKSKQSIQTGSLTSPIEPLTSKNLSKGSMEIFNNTTIEGTRKNVLKQKKSEPKNQNSQIYTTVDFHKPNRIKLKKIDQKEFEDKSSLKNRYSLNKKTII